MFFHACLLLDNLCDPFFQLLDSLCLLLVMTLIVVEFLRIHPRCFFTHDDFFFSLLRGAYKLCGKCVTFGDCGFQLSLGLLQFYGEFLHLVTMVD